MPRLAEAVVAPHYRDAQGRDLRDDAPAEQVAESVYDIPLKRGVMYAPHPAFARDDAGRYRYHALSEADTRDKRSPFDFAHSGTREVEAEDFVYAFKRHATPRIQAPLFGIFAEHVVGLQAYGERIRAEDARLRAGLDPASLDKPFLDFRRWPLEGVQALDRHTLRIRIKGKYPQWKYLSLIHI